MVQGGGFRFYDYAACAWGGARRKAQRLLSDVEELSCVESKCHHVHAKDEWAPQRQPGAGVTGTGRWSGGFKAVCCLLRFPKDILKTPQGAPEKPQDTDKSPPGGHLDGLEEGNKLAPKSHRETILS